MKNLDKVRTDIKALRDEEKAIIDAPLATTDIEHRLDVWIKEQEGVAIYLLGAASQLARPGRHGVSGWSLANDHIAQQPGLGVALSVFFNRDAFRSEVLRRALEEAPVEKQVPFAERPERLRKLREQIYQLNVVEERIVCEMERAGQAVSRRPDVDPYAVLGIPHPDYSEAATD